MHFFMSSAASSSSGRAGRPAAASGSAEQPAPSLGSAERPATLSHSLRSAERPATPSHLKLSSIRDVQRWLAQEPAVSCSSAGMQRVREAVAVLSRPDSRQEDVRPLQAKWRVARRRLPEVLQELQGKVINEAKKLQTKLSDSAEQPAQMGCLQEWSDWLRTLSEHVVSQSRPLQRARSATALLEMPPSRQQKEDIQSLLDDWGVPQKHRTGSRGGRKRDFSNLRADLVSRVGEETRRLKTIHDEAVAAIAAGPVYQNSPAWKEYSALHAAFQRGTA